MDDLVGARPGSRSAGRPSAHPPRRRDGAAGRGLLIGSLALGLLALGCGGPDPQRVVLVVIDTLRADHLSSYGGAVATPRIDSVAARGQRIERALAPFHQTSMSMGSLFTGRTPSLEAVGRRRLPWNGRTWCGLARFAEEGEQACLPAGLLTLAEMMRAAGYWTGAVVSNDLLFEPAGFARGFDSWHEVGTNTRAGEHAAPAPFDSYRRGSFYVNQAVEAVLAERPGDRFFLYVHYMDVHDYRIAFREYADSVTKADEAVGWLLDRLRQDALLEGTLLIVTADHGERLRGEEYPVPGEPGHKGNPSFQPLLRVPLIVAPPLFDDAARVVRGDQLLAALADRVGAPRALAVPAPELEPGELFVSELGWLTYQRGRWKSMRRRNGDRELLIDLERDPGEQHDVKDDFPEVVQQHRDRVSRLIAALGTHHTVSEGLTESDRRRLEALGYLD